MFLRRAIILPVFAFALIAIFNLILAEVFFFFLWLFASMMYFFIAYPIAVDMDDKTAPIFQIFLSLPLFILILAIAAFLDFLNTGISHLESALYGITVGFMVIALIMLLHGTKKK